jgi:precorrin-3B synthase
MNARARRGACPALSAPMPTGDGLLVRLAPAGTITLDAVAGLCAAAAAQGNGIIEVTARGSIQVRGLTAASAPAFARAVAAFGIDGTDGVPVIADPLAGLDPEEAPHTEALAADLRGALAAAGLVARLDPKVSIVVDGGAGLHLDAIAADVRLHAALRPEAARLHVALAGDAASAAPIGTVARERAVEATMRLLTVIAARGRGARARDVIRGEGTSALRAAIGHLLTEAPALPARPAAEPVGPHRLRDGRVAAGLGLAFGHTDATALRHLVDAMQAAGANGLRTAPGRALLVVGLVPTRAAAFGTAAERLGFIVRPDDPRRHVAACSGMPLCASAQLPTRGLAPAIASAAASLLDGSLTIHLSGCAKGCAHARAAALTLVGDGTGCGIVVNGSASDPPLGSIVADTLPSGLERLAGEVERERRPDERAADALSRLGTARIVALLQEADRA